MPIETDDGNNKVISSTMSEDVVFIIESANLEQLSGSYYHLEHSLYPSKCNVLLLQSHRCLA
jgi:hypothetical protein